MSGYVGANGALAFNQDMLGCEQCNRCLFEGATAFNQDISGWNVSKVENMSRMFKGATAFNQDIGKMGCESCAGGKIRRRHDQHVFKFGSFYVDYSLLVAWAALDPPVQNGVRLGAGSGYCSSIATAARTTLTSTKRWTINDGGSKDCEDVTLSTLTVSNATNPSSVVDISGSMSPSFSSDRYTYTLAVVSAVDTLTVVGAPASSSAAEVSSYTRNGSDAGDGSKIVIEPGSTTIKIVVTAGDGTTTQTYTIDVSRPILASDAALSSLMVGGDMITGFTPDVTAYTVNVGNEIATIDVSGTARNSSATVSYTRNSECRRWIRHST